jgi:hypothetical protein
MVPTVKTIRKKNPVTKFKATKLPPRGVVSLSLRPMAGAGTGRVSSRRVKMTFYDLEHSVHEDIIAMTDDLAEISAKVTALLNGLHPEDNFVVRRLAKEISEAIAVERAVEDGDMVSVITTLNAALEPMIAWLEGNGCNGQSLRRVTPMNNRDQIGHSDDLSPAALPNAPSDDPKAPDVKEDDDDDKVIGRIYAPPGYGLAYVEMMKDNYRRWAAAGDPLYIEIVKQMDGDDTEEQDDPNAHHGHARR